jgi:hypothetical protein
LNRSIFIPSSSQFKGNDVIHQLTKNNDTSIHFSITLKNGNTYYQEYDRFSISDESDGYRLYLSKPTKGTLGMHGIHFFLFLFTNTHAWSIVHVYTQNLRELHLETFWFPKSRDYILSEGMWSIKKKGGKVFELLFILLRIFHSYGNFNFRSEGSLSLVT